MLLLAHGDDPSQEIARAGSQPVCAGIVAVWRHRPVPASCHRRGVARNRSGARCAFRIIAARKA
jgi:hypothetical protein